MVEHRRSALRTAVVWDLLQTELAGLDSPVGTGEEGTAKGPQGRVVDLGGGTGEFAVRVAELGHEVTVVDPSPDALAALDRRAADAGVVERVHAIQGDAADLSRLVEAGSVDVVLCHGVLEYVDDPAAALDAISAVLRPDGILSVLVANRLATVMARALAGHFDQAGAVLDASAAQWDLRTQGPRRYTRDEAVQLLRDSAFTLQTVHAVRVFTDLVPSALVDTEPGAPAALLALERAAANVPELAAVASQLHLLARRT
ncbi:MAG: methyltransferase domain-containing protein [Nocardioidaceae bacterium]|nr:methyltransferase domain-containing protein [Nocardioidaceae bacterium]